VSHRPSWPVEPAPLPAGLRERHKERRRRAILQAVRDLLRDGAETDLTKDRIAERAEVAPATVYNLVGTRARLWAALAEDFTAELDRRLARSRPADPVARLRQVIGATVDLFVEDPKVTTRMLRGWEESGQVLRGGPVVHFLAALEAAQQAGVLAPGVDVRLLSASIATSCVGALHQWAAAMIDAPKLRAAAMLAADMALAAAASEEHRQRLQKPLRRRRALGPSEDAA
jgi:AcrR family transcriptional regulator